MFIAMLKVDNLYYTLATTEASVLIFDSLKAASSVFIKLKEDGADISDLHISIIEIANEKVLSNLIILPVTLHTLENEQFKITVFPCLGEDAGIMFTIGKAPILDND